MTKQEELEKAIERVAISSVDNKHWYDPFYEQFPEDNRRYAWERDLLTIAKHYLDNLESIRKIADGAVIFSKAEMEFIRNLVDNTLPDCKPASMTDNEWKEFLAKIS